MGRCRDLCYRRGKRRRRQFGREHLLRGFGRRSARYRRTRFVFQRQRLEQIVEIFLRTCRLHGHQRRTGGLGLKQRFDVVGGRQDRFNSIVRGLRSGIVRLVLRRPSRWVVIGSGF